MGLGLTVVKCLSRPVVHPVPVQSALGSSSHPSIGVPSAPMPTSAKPVAGRDPRADAGGLALVVDDDAIILLGLQQIVESLGYAVVIATDADQAEARIAKDGRTPDLILTDYRLRGGRVGTEVVARVRALTGAPIPGLVLTGEDGPEVAAAAAEHGLRLLQKPVTPQQLARCLDDLRRPRTA